MVKLPCEKLLLKKRAITTRLAAAMFSLLLLRRDNNRGEILPISHLGSDRISNLKKLHLIEILRVNSRIG